MTGTGVGRRAAIDLRGWSALPLLAAVESCASPLLFVTGRTTAWVSRGALVDADFVDAPGAYDSRWPFGAGELRGVIIDGDALAERGDDDTLRHVVAEATRATRSSGSVSIVCRHRRVPRRLRAWREYRRPSAERWQRAAANLGLHGRTDGIVGLDGDRVTEIGLMADGSRAPHADRVVLGVTTDEKSVHTVESIVSEASATCGIALKIERIAVRKIGKTAVFLTAGDGRRFVMRIARSPIALSRADRNFETLKWLHASNLPDWLKTRLPATIARGTHAGYPYFVEGWLDGVAGPRRSTGSWGARWEPEAVRYISALHVATARREILAGDAMAAFVGQPVARLVENCDTRVTSVLGRVEACCQASLEGRVLPLVRTHGDFTESNCLFDARGGLTGVIDWEVSQPDGLPLLDLLQLMPIPGEEGSHPRWQRFDAWLELVRDPARAAAEPVLGEYMRALDIPLETIPGLVLVQWLTHVADRLEARRDDERWIRLRVQQPLETLGRTL